MEKIETLIHAKWIITCEEKNLILENHALAMNAGKIIAILPSQEADKKYQATRSQRFPNHALLPGFINSHTHIAMNYLRGIADDLALMDWLNNHIWPAEKKWVNDQFVYDASKLAMAEMIRSGTTCFNDMYFFLNATARAAEEVGIRAFIGMQVIGVPTAWAETIEEYFEKGLAFYHEYKDHPLITPLLTPHSTYTLSVKDLERTKQIASDHDLKINIHLQETASEVALSMAQHKKRPLALLNDLGMVDDNLIAVHMTQINEQDMKILQAQKPHIVHCPESNMKLASGACPIHMLMEANVNVALGTDGAASNNDLDMIGEMRAAAFLAKLTANNPQAAPAETVLKMATLHGARALGIDHLTGSLTPGKSADVIAINLSEIETQPLYHATSQIVYASTRNQVTDVWIAGKHVLKDRQLQTIDEKEVLSRAKTWQEKISK